MYRFAVSCRGSKRTDWRIDMINYDEEIKKFQPSLEVDEAEDAIYNNDMPDVTDIINRIMNELTMREQEQQL